MTPTPRPGAYEPAGFFLVRASVLPASAYADLSDTSGSGDADAIRRRTRERLRAAAADQRVAQAVHISSTSTTKGLNHLGGDPDTDKRAARAYSTLLRYLIRMTTRPTPYGLSAGVGFGQLEPRTTLGLAADPVARTRTRADIAWLLTLVKELEAGALRPGLGVITNPLLYRTTERAVLPFADVYGQSDTRQIDIRLTAPVALALDMAGSPAVSLNDIVDRITAEIPGATRDRAEDLIGKLWDLHFLMSDLRPAPTEPLPELDLAKRLADVPGAESLRAGLLAVRQLADEVDAKAGHGGTGALDQLVAHQHGLTPGYDRETFQLDTALATTDTGLCAEVGEAAAEAAEVLLRVGATRVREPHIVEYHAAFLEKYGVEAEIPLLELLSPESGMEAPAGYTGPRRGYPLPAVDQPELHHSRDQALVAMLTETLHSGRGELELTDARLAQLQVWDPVSAPAVRPAVDLFTQLVAADAEAVDRGDWRLVVTPSGMADGGRTFGRFFDLLDEDALDRLRSYARAEEKRCPEVDFAELSYLSPYGRAGNVTLHPQLRRYEICVNTAPSLPPEAQIALDDIVVGATGERFYLRSLRTGRELRVTQSHMLTPATAPNVCRLLLELSEDGIVPLAGWDWGAAARAPYLPRVTRGRLVLAAAQWLFAAPSVGVRGTGPLPGRDEFHAAVQTWRAAWRVPRHVYLAWMDNRLLLDLENPLFVDELREELRRARRGAPAAGLILHEALPGLDGTWLADAQGRGYFSELIFPLLSRDRVRRPAINRRPPALPGPAAPRRRLAGEEWAYLKLYASLNRHDDLLTGEIPTFVSDLRAAGVIDRWFYLRYCDPYPHLRLRLRAAAPEHARQLPPLLTDWARGLVRAGRAADFALVSYDREIERYGGPAAIDTVEGAFEANSDMAVALIGALRSGAVGVDPDLAMVVALHRMAIQWGRDPFAALPATGNPDVPDAARRAFRGQQKLLTGLLQPWPAHPDPEAERWYPPLSEILDQPAPVITTAGRRLAELAAADQLIGTPGRILDSLLHMSANRVLGMDQERERRAHEMWALGLSAVRHRPEAAK